MKLSFALIFCFLSSTFLSSTVIAKKYSWSEEIDLRSDLPNRIELLKKWSDWYLQGQDIVHGGRDVNGDFIVCLANDRNGNPQVGFLGGLGELWKVKNAGSSDERMKIEEKISFKPYCKISYIKENGYLNEESAYSVRILLRKRTKQARWVDAAKGLRRYKQFNKKTNQSLLFEENRADIEAIKLLADENDRTDYVQNKMEPVLVKLPRHKNSLLWNAVEGMRDSEGKKLAPRYICRNSVSNHKTQNRVGGSNGYSQTEKKKVLVYDQVIYKRRAEQELDAENLEREFADDPEKLQKILNVMGPTLNSPAQMNVSFQFCNHGAESFPGASSGGLNSIQFLAK